MLYNIPGNFCRVQFSQMIDLDQFVGLIFVEAHTHTHYVLYNQVYFAGLIFVVRRSSTKKT